MKKKFVRLAPPDVEPPSLGVRRGIPPRHVLGRSCSLLLGVAMALVGASACATGETGTEPEPTPAPETGPCECGVFEVVGTMASDRYSHAALRLDNGDVLITTGNDDDGSVTSVELFSPASASSLSRADFVGPPRFGVDLHQVNAETILAFHSGSEVAAYDVTTDEWTVLPPARLGHNRAATVHTSAGIYLVAGASFPFLDRFDVDNQVWEELPNLRYGREAHTATELEDGRLLIVGGYDSTQFINQGATEIFDPVIGESAEAGSLEVPRQLHEAVRLNDGRVLIAGGFGPDIAIATASTEIYDPSSGTWERAGDLPGGRVEHTLTLLSDGRVLLVGGIDPSLNAPYQDAILFDPRTNAWRRMTAGLARPRQGHATVATDDGALIFGGNESSFNDFAAASNEVERLTLQ